MKVRILVVDDSAFMRKILTEQISAITDFEVIGTARNGEDALKKLELLKPDVITLDVEMPGMNGLETVQRIRETHDLPVFMLSSLQGKDITIQALESGATDFIEKPQNLRQNAPEFQHELAYRIKNVLHKEKKSEYKGKVAFRPFQVEELMGKGIKAMVIGASTGGPKALLQLVKELPADLAIPVFIVQHMPEGFTTSFANRLNDSSKVKVTEAKHKQKIEPGVVSIAPGNYHMTLQKDEIHLIQTEKVNGVRPAVDILFDSAAQLYGSDLLATILTGMGKDGTKGMETIKQKGGYTLAQSQESCVVYGMPGSAMNAGVVDICTDLIGISTILNEVAR